MPKKESKLPLIIGIAIPVAMILFVAGAIYLPHLFAAPPQYDFVYAVQKNQYNQQYYYSPQTFLTYFEVKDQKLSPKAFPAYDATIDYKAANIMNSLQYNNNNIVQLFSKINPAADQGNNKAAYDSQKALYIAEQTRVKENIQLYVYSVKTNEGRPSTFDEASALRLDSNALSSDGFQVTQGGYNNGTFFFFGGGGYTQGYVITGSNSYRKRLNLPEGFVNILFLGWKI